MTTKHPLFESFLSFSYTDLYEVFSEKMSKIIARWPINVVGKVWYQIRDWKNHI